MSSMLSPAGDGRGIDPHPHGRLLIAFDRHEADAADFAELLRQHGVGEIVYLFQRQRVGSDFQREIGVSAGLTLL